MKHFGKTERNPKTRYHEHELCKCKGDMWSGVAKHMIPFSEILSRVHTIVVVRRRQNLVYALLPRLLDFIDDLAAVFCADFMMHAWYAYAKCVY